MKKLRVAIVGCGRISVVYRDAFRALAERVEVCCAIDKVPERAAAFAADFAGCRAGERIELCGERGRALLTGDVVEIALEGQPPYKVVPEQGQTSGETYWGCYHLAQLRDFYQNLVEDIAVPVNPADATKTLELVLGIYTSGKENRTVRL